MSLKGKQQKQSTLIVLLRDIHGEACLPVQRGLLTENRKPETCDVNGPVRNSDDFDVALGPITLVDERSSFLLIFRENNHEKSLELTHKLQLLRSKAPR